MKGVFWYTRFGILKVLTIFFIFPDLIQVKVLAVSSSEVALKLSTHDKIKVSFAETFVGNATKWIFSDSKVTFTRY